MEILTIGKVKLKVTYTKENQKKSADDFSWTMDIDIIKRGTGATCANRNVFDKLKKLKTSNELIKHALKGFVEDMDQKYGKGNHNYSLKS